MTRRDFAIVHNVTSRQSFPDFHILIYKTEACGLSETDSGHDPSHQKVRKVPVPQGQHWLPGSVSGQQKLLGP